MPGILATRSDALSPRMLRILEDLSADWRRLDARVEDLSSEIEAIARQDKGCERLMSVPGIGPVISSAATYVPPTGFCRVYGVCGLNFHPCPVRSWTENFWQFQ